ncbi:MAG TPA: hypothetical protein PKD37_03870 [Oligoflexia bacterium]|nr:hypothetical protein [Oligoflexia bacterium]HMP27105.1 hypothetical protein [Oligoflexia bacterium]
MIELLEESGEGRSFVIIIEKSDSDSRNSFFFANSLALVTSLSKFFKATLIALPKIDQKNWGQIGDSLHRFLKEHGIRQTSFLASGSATTIVQYLSLIDLKLVRTICMINPYARPHPTRLTRFIDSIERFFPMGLPFKHTTSDFDGFPFLQRIRCPVLVLSEKQASNYEKSQAEKIVQALPTAWLVSINKDEDPTPLITRFQETPAKCPQKNV